MPPRRQRRPEPPLLSLPARLARALRGPGDPAPSGPAVARLFHRLLAAIFLVAWLSLAAQIDVLVGSRGLLPAAPYVASLRAAGTPFSQAPTFFTWIGASDAALHGGVAAGALLAILAFAGVAPRLCFALSTILYLGYAVACRTFLGFQWDNLLLECGLLAALLPRHRRAPWAHFLLRVLLFKLYFESGLAKWQSPLHDWHDGSAMTYYYETAPLPARLAWYAHHLPAWWHAFEGWFTLFFELPLALLVFGPRRPRLVALLVFTTFQVVDLATANYGFFCYLALALSVLLLAERDVLGLRALVLRRLPALRRARVRARWMRLRLHHLPARLGLPTRLGLPALPTAHRRALRRGAAGLAVAAYLSASLVEALLHFGGSPALAADLAPYHDVWSPFRLVNTYHLFAAITRERVEPQLETSADGVTWIAHDLRYKPGDPARAPTLVAPHQPRLDFQLWFFGLGHRRGAPPYVTQLLDRVCHDPAAVQALFPAPLPARPASVRLAFHRYHFTTPAERAATGAWWRREPAGVMQPVHCVH